VAIIGTNLNLIPTDVLPQALLAVLALLAIDALIERMRILEQVRLDLDTLVGGDANPTVEFEREICKRTPLTDYLRGVNSLFVSGGSLIGLVVGRQVALQKWLDQNRRHKLFLLIEDPRTAKTSRTPVYSSLIDKTRQAYASDIERTQLVLQVLMANFPGQIVARLTQEVPSLSVMMADRRKARISLNLYRGATETRPAFELSRSRHPAWFQLFEERYRDTLWQQAKPWQPAEPESPAN
jgi:hypothetical protein